MKTILATMAILFFVYTGVAQDFYYYQGEKLMLDKDSHYVYIYGHNLSEVALREKMKPLGELTKFIRDDYFRQLDTTYRSNSVRLAGNYFQAELKLSNTIPNREEGQKLLEAFKSDPDILDISFHYTYNGGDHFAVTNSVWIQLKQTSDIRLLQEKASQIQFAILGQHAGMKDWVMLAPQQHAGMTALQATQFFYETGLFTASEPHMLVVPKSACVNDPLFNEQWGWSNTGQAGGVAGMDANVCEAWNYTVGNSTVDIAILDDGFENNHPDLDDHLANTGYDPMTGTSPTGIYGSHGTACAGIAAAAGNNNLGVAGVAYGSDLMSVSVLGTVTYAQMSDGFIWAMNNGAEIMSNSWTVSPPSSLLESSILTASIFGRNNLGCLILFCTMNSNNNGIAYPSSLPYVIAVGAANRFGERAGFSNYGSGLDVVAPGQSIATTDRVGANGYNSSAGATGDYTLNFSGTSAACPFAAGVIALMLSVNPCLTNAQATSILKRTAQKIGPYVYTPSSDPDGSWNNEMGYGMVDALAAVELAQASYLQNMTITGLYNYSSVAPIVQAGYSVTSQVIYGNFVTTNTSNVTIQAPRAIDFKPGCDLQGSVNTIITQAPVGHCSTW